MRLKNMFDFIKKRFVVAEVDGIKFYRDKSLQKYLDRRDERMAKAKSREGKNCYTFEIPWYQRDTVSDAKVILEKHGVFDYDVMETSNGYAVKYWSKSFILGWKGL